MEEINNYPLVTVIVVTYNSSKYVLETLNSIKKQTYQKIELIVSDDCSQDNTVQLCNEWIEKNTRRFVGVKVMTTSHNTGTSGNANRAWKASSGKWIKFIGGDDLLFEDAIYNYINFVGHNVSACFANTVQFTGDIKECNYKTISMPLKNFVFGHKATARRQYAILKRQLIGNGPTFFVKRKIIEDVGGFDERFPLMDDYPLFIRISQAGYKFYLMPQATVYYRNHIESVSHQKGDNAIFHANLVRCIRDYKYEYKHEHLSKTWKVFLRYSILISNMIINNGNSRKNSLCMLFYYIYLVTDPFLWYSRYVNFIDKVFAKF